jgi:pSer/pThr/pTyr-binding forkhead associated (FHA) protein
MPRLVIRKGEGVGRDHPLAEACEVGRNPVCQFVLADLLVSRRHYRVFPEGGAWWVEDLGSRNGTLVNGQRAMEKRRLADGDRIAAGGTEVEFVQKDLLGAPAAPVPAVPAVVPPAVPAAPAKPAPTPEAGKPFAAPVPRRRRER